MQKQPDVVLVTVLRSTNPAHVAFAKSLLQTENIDYFVRGETLRNVRGWGAVVDPVEFQVRQPDAAHAVRLLSDLV